MFNHIHTMNSPIFFTQKKGQKTAAASATTGPHFATGPRPRVARSRRERTPWASSPERLGFEDFTYEKYLMVNDGLIYGE